MKEPNPYRSPAQTAESIEPFHPRFDAGKLTARYLQLLGVLSLIGMLVSLAFFDRLNLDFSCPFSFWAAHHLLKHSPTARTWVIVICTINLLGMALILILLTLHQFELVTLAIKNSNDTNSLVLPTVVFVALIILLSIPIWLLNTEEAKREFLLA